MSVKLLFKTSVLLIMFIFVREVNAQIPTDYENRFMAYIEKTDMKNFYVESGSLNDAIDDDWLLERKDKNSNYAPDGLNEFDFENQSLYRKLESDLRGRILERKIAAAKGLMKYYYSLQETVEGRVVDADTGEPLPGVNIAVKGTTRGTTTDSNGEYELVVESLQDVLIFSFIGYETQEVGLQGRSNLNITLASTIRDLGEATVIAVAYGSQKASSLTGSVSSVSADDFRGVPKVGIEASLQGSMPGLQISNDSGQPGSLPSVTIRGIGSINASSRPLYVIDGVPIQDFDFTGYNTNVIAGIEQDDIESISVLKDASAASLYGSRAANGVILITTKSGAVGEPRIEFSVEQGFNKYSLADRMNPLSTPEMLELLREGWVNAGQNPSDFMQDVIVAGGIDTTISTNWLDVLTRTGLYSKYSLSASGGSENTVYRFSTNYTASESVMKGVDYERMGGSMNLSTKVGSGLNFDGGVLFSYQKSNTVTETSSFTNPFYYMQRLQPWAPVRDQNGDMVLSYTSSASDNNPLAFVEAVTRQGLTYNLMPDAKLSYEIIEGLSVESAASINLVFGETVNRQPSNFTSSAQTNGSGSKANRKFSSWISTSIARYNTSIGGIHNFDILAGFEIQKTNLSGTSAAAVNFLPHTIYLDGSSTPTSSSSYFNDNSIVSQFGKLDYNYDDRYYASFSVRRDGSSKFYGSDKLYGTFYSVGLSWNITNEEFLMKQDFLTNLRLRASYGENGNQSIPNYAALGLYNMTLYSGEPALLYSQINNSLLTWEKNKPFNVGLEIGIVKNRFRGTIDYFSRVTSDLLFNKPIPAVNGVLDYNQNIGEMKNTGIEIALSSNNIIPGRQGGFSWTTDFNITSYKNTITKLPSPLIDITFKREEGRSFYDFYLVGYAGVDSQTGEALWWTDETKSAKTNVYSQAERFYQGSAIPKFYGNLSNHFNYKNLSLSFSLYYNYGNILFHNWGRYTETDGSLMTNIRGKMSRQIYKYRWQKPGDEALLPKIVYGGTQSASSSYRDTRLTYDGSYVRLKDITLAYDIDFNSQLVNSAQVYVSASNMLTFLKDKRLAFDPEISTNGLLDNRPPNAKTIIFGLRVKL